MSNSSSEISKLSALAAGQIAPADLTVLVDVTDTSMAASGTNKNATLSSVAASEAFSSRYFNAMSFTNGQMTTPRLSLDASITPTSGRLNLAYFVADKSFPAAKVRSVSRGTACSALTRCRYGVWQIDGSGNATMVASTPDDTSLFTATFTTYPKNFSAPVNIVQGQTYAAGWLITGTIGVFYSSQISSALGNLPPRVIGDITTADLPASFTDAGVALNSSQIILAGIFTAAG